MKENNRKILTAELARLQKITGCMYGFDLVWKPLAKSNIEGKVEENTITIHSENINDAIDTLQHEFIDYMISQSIHPYVALVNSLISIISRQAYKTKENTVEGLIKIINSKS